MPRYESIFQELNEAAVRYVVVGGLAVVLHGHPRMTADVDLAVDLSPDGSRRVIDALLRLGFVPRVPVDPRGFADRDTREAWKSEKRMQVFSMLDPGDPFRTVDLFVEDPVPFEELYERSVLVVLRTTSVRIASIPDLVVMKRRAGRPQDLLDIEALQAIEEKRRG